MALLGDDCPDACQAAVTCISRIAETGNETVTQEMEMISVGDSPVGSSVWLTQVGQKHVPSNEIKQIWLGVSEGTRADERIGAGKNKRLLAIPIWVQHACKSAEVDTVITVEYLPVQWFTVPAIEKQAAFIGPRNNHIINSSTHQLINSSTHQLINSSTHQLITIIITIIIMIIIMIIMTATVTIIIYYTKTTLHCIHINTFSNTASCDCRFYIQLFGHRFQGI